MTRKALGLAAALVLGVSFTVAVAQVRRPSQPMPAPQTPAQLALRALNEGRYDEVASITGKDQFDPTLVSIHARALIARGQYKEAEDLLRPSAQRQPVSDSALELGLLLRMLSRDEGTAILGRVADSAATANRAADLARAARALRALGRFDESNAAYRDAATAAPRDPAIQTAWGEMFIEGRCQTCTVDAMKSFDAALKEDPKWTPAIVGMAEAMSEQNPPEAVKTAEKALEINPSSVDAHLFIAAEAADAGHRDDARTSIQKALEVNPNSLDAHALLGALAYIEDKTPEFEQSIQKVLSISPKYGEAYRLAGEFAAHNYRFDEAVTLVRKGLALDPDNPRALSDLGTHLLRTGDEQGARAALERSFKEHPYDVVSYNLLQMMDTLDKFVTIREGDFVIRMDKADAVVMQDSVVALAKDAMAAMTKRYGFTPKGPILIEIFPKHDDFAVRNVGLPGMIGALGACFGRVVTMDSPKARPPGDFQWAGTLWHELAHVITLQMSNQRVPRWLTEGISEYEEKIARPEWARGMDVEFAGLLNRGQTIKLAELNASFQDPRRIGLAYFQASLLVEHIVATYGDEGLHKLLRAYGQGLETDAAMKAAIGVGLADMQAAFDRRMEDKYGTMRAALKEPPEGVNPAKMSLDEVKAYAAKNPDNYIAQMALGVQLRKTGDFDGAVAAFRKAATLVPQQGGEDSPHALIAEIAQARRDNAGAIQALQSLVDVDFNNIDAARQLAKLMRDSGMTEPTRLERVYTRIVDIDPFDADARAQLGRVLMRQNKADAASREFKAVVAMNPVDQAAAYTDLAESYFQSGKRAEARRQTLAALEVAPSYERAQDLLLKLAEARP
ncbi:MAG: tetratricopeptide repeat protein [Acidobacteria bacterium]|nr:tetratricopeptide repeat protein [Acidobacteriota bacterium]